MPCEPKALFGQSEDTTLTGQSTVQSNVGARSTQRLASGATLADGRLTIVRTLGEGGMGTVYEAQDADRRCSVALKTLSHTDPTGVYSFKNEFRFLAGVRHRNLVQLHELHAEGDMWYFTMELVHGEQFDRWVRPGQLLDEPRLRHALRELIAGAAEIHSLGRVHRDLKPNNVLVTTDGRVVVLDFGLVAESQPGGVGHTLQSFSFAGTPAYMSPEQALGAEVSSACDLYAVGTMLFEALVGQRPFTGSVSAILLAKQHEDPPHPSSLDAHVPADLAELCLELLARDPQKRPTLGDIRTRLGMSTEFRSISEGPGTLVAPLGRDRELEQLREAYAATLRGECVVVVITGESGIGKTSLCEYFIRELREAGSAIVLAGRCREQESVPFKALDVLVDELSRYLRRLPDDRAAVLLPRDAFALQRLFPVLGRVPAIAAAPPPAGFASHEVQRRGFRAFGELLARIRDRQPLCVHLDDLHWTDADSVALLRHLLIDRNPLPALVVIAHRSGNDDNPLLANVLDAAASNSRLRMKALPLTPLSRDHTEQLAALLLRSSDIHDPKLAAAIARESRGSPFFATELARSARDGVDAARDTLSFAAALQARVAGLTEEARTIVELLALVGRPLPVEVLWEVVCAESKDLDVLRATQLTRSRELEGKRAIECYHDRIRESLCASLSDERRRKLYLALSEVLSRRADSDPELLSTCLEYTGDRSGAAHYAALAAAHASAIMAFANAATLYQRALELSPSVGDARRELLEKLGYALEHAGHGRAAAHAYIEAASLSTAEHAIELRRRAAEQLLATGHLDEGVVLIKEVCRQVGVVMPTGKRTALASYLWNSAQLRVRTLDSPSRHAVPDHEKLKLRIASTLVTGLIGYLPIQTASCASRYLRLALTHGDRTDLIRGLGFHAYIQTLVEPASRHATSLLERMDQLANELGTPDAIGFASLMKGTSAYHCGHFSVAREHLALAVRTMRGCSGLDWEIDCAHIYDQLIASDTGMYAHITRTTPVLIEEALRRGRLWTAAMLSGFGVHAWLVPDNPAGYSSFLAAAKNRWQGARQARWPDFVLLAGESQQLIYQDKAHDAFELFESQLDRFASSEVMRSAGAGIGGYVAHHGKAAAAALRSGGAQGAQSARKLAVLRDAVASLRKSGGAKRTGIASMLEASAALENNDAPGAYTRLLEAIRIYDSVGANMWAAAARRRAGQLVQGEAGAALMARGDDFMSSQGVQNYEAMTEVNCPGCRARS